jgi:hypothetical protein
MLPLRTQNGPTQRPAIVKESVNGRLGSQTATSVRRGMTRKLRIDFRPCSSHSVFWHTTHDFHSDNGMNVHVSLKR